MLTYSAVSAGRAAEAWDLMARPARWHEWAPHIRGAAGLGAPEVVAGNTGVVRLAGVVPVPARIVDKEPGRSWTWVVGPVRLNHRVEPRGRGCEVAVDLSAPGPVEAALRVTYGPLVALLMRNLARKAAQPG